MQESELNLILNKNREVEMETSDNAHSSRIEIGPDLFSALIKVLDDPTGNTRHPNIAFSGRSSSQKISIVGESFYQEAIKRFKGNTCYGFLVPDQNNQFDKNAVALYLIDKDLMIHRVGHLPRQLAARVSQSIANLLASENKIIPVKAKIEGGTVGKPTMGVFATAKTNFIKFN